MASFQERGVKTLVVLTKADKLKGNELKKNKQSITESLTTYGIAKEDIIVSSSLKKTGINELRSKLFTK